MNLKNPCKKCIVKACCTQICEEKRVLVDYLDKEVYYYRMFHTADPYNKRYKKYKKTIEKAHRRNRRDVDKINHRKGISYDIFH